MYLRKALVLFVCFSGISLGETGNRLVIVKDGVKQTIGSWDEYRNVDLLNARRVRAGLRPLVVSEKLMKFARNWSMTQAKRHKMFHSGGPYAENIAMHSNGTPETMDRMWQNSSGHRKNRMGSRWKYVGIGYVRASNGVEYATEVFSTKP